MKIIVIDTSYNYSTIKKLDLFEAIYSRDLNNYFMSVFSIHPVGSFDLNTNDKNKYGGFTEYKINNIHTFIEGKEGFFFKLKNFKKLNFLISQLILLYNLRKLIINKQINFLKAGSLNYAGLFTYILSKITNTPYVVRVGSNNDKIFEVTRKPMEKKFFKFRTIEKFFEKIVLKNAKYVIAANNDNLKFAIKNGALKKKSCVIRYGNLIHKTHFIDPSKRNFDDLIFSNLRLTKGKYIIYLGRLEKVKHPEDVIEVFDKTFKEFNNYKLVICGDGSLMNELKNLTAIKKIDNNVLFLGNISQKMIYNLAPNAKVCISPHTGRALAEIALSEIPIVAYDIDWQSELIEHEVTGELVEYRNINKLASSVKKIILNDTYSKKISSNLRKKCMILLDPKKSIDNEINIYNQ